MLERGFFYGVIVDYFFDLKVQSDFVDYLFRAGNTGTGTCFTP